MYYCGTIWPLRKGTVCLLILLTSWTLSSPSFRRRSLGLSITSPTSALFFSFFSAKMAAGPLSAVSNTSTNNDGILIGDKVYSEVYLTIDNSLIPEERLSPTPSMLDGLDLSTETDLRILGCELIQSAGILLRLPQVRHSTKMTIVNSLYTFLFHTYRNSSVGSFVVTLPRPS